MALSKCESLSEKITKTLELYGQTVVLSREYLGDLIRGTVLRILAIKDYKQSYQHLKSDLVLLKASQLSFTTNFDETDDYGLSAISKKTVPVYTIEGNHSSILGNVELANIINSKLLN